MRSPDSAKKHKILFENLTPLNFPTKRFNARTRFNGSTEDLYDARIVDLIVPHRQRPARADRLATEGR